jgi:hypothetical protein
MPTICAFAMHRIDGTDWKLERWKSDEVQGAIRDN